MAHAVTQLCVIALQLLSERHIQRFSGVLAELHGQFIEFGESGFVLILPAGGLLRIADGDHAQNVDVHAGQRAIDIVHRLGCQEIPVIERVDVLGRCLECMDHENR
ncbi:hypothetical protein CFBP3846_01319 [Pseudomonas syringae pv. avii]|uniref:Uncharacterized protein n=2 Tax=Pseudomonas syringae group TaxID=136849 RepID=A0A2K4TGB9_9PSED|nr:hypothetical protein ALQ30_200363 [Pseudomonas syringae pv. persicae]SOQ07234.1 hypothetical protein NCPPB2254_01206 [Pseudomonas syringae pv. persicae]SOQ07394.1 hypothetical protein CFBP1573P_01431 [Pseudomonas syringae pv. persicae]SOS25754.1 hypothetical protein CFBP3846_01319 [Pseudomonas syringae pv. avii]